MAQILILGWGSLIWRPDKLKTVGDWSLDGPTLPVEFSRISNNKRLTLVIDETNGVPVKSRFVRSACGTLEDAIENLRVREGAPSAKGIGYVDINNGSFSGTALERHKATAHEIAKWGKTRDADAVIWTAIGPRWPFEGSFSVEAAARYVELAGTDRAQAHEFVCRAPQEIETPVRKRF
ncbi:hypothetical protein IVA93_31760 [Bradyrhizobium sp. 155]|uniref:hypothetical protein n=1 Tax=Bradyrhizobium sp. 155 TaxID=2782629 RepID=UPI0020004D46|nr:hypothetical protein [Bradyrhizobium sp. 155]UPK10731.1 hypothetical protein IVA93_31760 [Bradyrhizobium sp. 155]